MKTILRLLQRRLSHPRQNAQAVDRERAQEALSCYTFVGGIGQGREKDLLRSLCKSYALARSFAESRDFSEARRRLGQTQVDWAPAPSPRCSLLVANGSLTALSLIADAGIQGWQLIVEDCPFSRRFISPLASRTPGKLELRSGHLLRARQNEMIQTGNRAPVLFVSFCDRPMWTVGDSLEAQVAGGRYHFSVVDVLLMVAASDVFILGKEVHGVDLTGRVDRSTGLISGDTLFHATTLCSNALSELMEAAPDCYLGIAQLVTRNLKYRANIERNKKALIRSLLHYCQVSGLSLPAQNYRGLLLALDAPGHDSKAEPAFT